MPLVVWVATSTQPTTYSGAHVVPCHRPSIDASLMGCSWVTSTAMLAPKTATFEIAKTMNNGRAREKLARARSRCRFFSRYQALTLSISAAPAVHDATQTWRRRGMNDGVKTTSTKDVMTARAGAGSLTTS